MRRAQKYQYVVFSTLILVLRIQTRHAAQCDDTIAATAAYKNKDFRAFSKIILHNLSPSSARDDMLDYVSVISPTSLQSVKIFLELL